MHEMEIFMKKTEKLVIYGLFTAIVCVLSAIPFGFTILSVPATLQIFAIGLCAFTLNHKAGAIIATLYMLIGLSGIPVFNGFKGGFSHLFGPTGGFIIGFIVLAFFCGYSNRLNNIFAKAALCILGLLICHLLGVIQFSFVMDMNILKSFSLVSAPYLPKDALLLAIAYSMAFSIKKALSKSKLLKESF